MKEQYGSPEKAEQVLHASANKGTISGIDAGVRAGTSLENTQMQPSLAAHVAKSTNVNNDPLEHGKKGVGPHSAFTIKDY